MILQRTFARIRNRIRNIVHHARIAVLTREASYRQYLQSQLDRTLTKNQPILQKRTVIFVDTISELISAKHGISLLCVGCRNEFELQYFNNKGFDDVIGIDLFSEHPRIFVMDMHSMTFPNDHFDLVYSSHSLEHSQYPDRVAREIVRVTKPGGIVAIEVPIKFETTVADLIDVGSIDALHQLFSPHLDQAIWSEEQPPHTDRNNAPTHIVRTVFSLKK